MYAGIMAEDDTVDLWAIQRLDDWTYLTMGAGDSVLWRPALAHARLFDSVEQATSYGQSVVYPARLQLVHIRGRVASVARLPVARPGAASAVVSVGDFSDRTFARGRVDGYRGHSPAEATEPYLRGYMEGLDE